MQGQFKWPAPAPAEPSKTRLQCSILGEEYRLRVDGTAAEAQRVVDYLNQELARLQEKANLPRSQLAILAALNITATLLQLQAEHDSLLDYLTQSEREAAPALHTKEEENGELA